jgi:signal transduction histidine kinase
VKNNPLWLFNMLAIVILSFFGWWAYMIYDLHTEIHAMLELVGDPDQHELVHASHRIERDRIMLYSEGAVFLILLLAGIWLVRRSVNRGFKLASQERNFMLAITHELKSPLASIKLGLQTMLRRRMTDEEGGKLTGNAIQDVDRLTDLVDNILMTSRLEAPGYTYERMQLDFSQLVQATGEKKQAEANQRINMDIEPAIGLMGDELALQSMLLNLLDNAVKYAPDGPIHISLSKDNDSVHLEVSDEGPGIEEDEKLQIFDKFYRIGDERVRTSKGTGLGLYVVKEVVLGHGGHVTVSDNGNKGSRFSIVLKSSTQA